MSAALKYACHFVPHLCRLSWVLFSFSNASELDDGPPYALNGTEAMHSTGLAGRFLKYF
jgi:hypothetical protein